MSEPKAGVLPYLALLTLALIWGISFVFIKVAVHDMSPTVIVLVRSVAGIAMLVAILSAMRRPLFGPDWRSRVVPFLVMAVLNAVLPWALIAWGEERITSGLASILNATVPIWAAIMTYWILPSDRPSTLNYIGVLVGLAGVVILVLPRLAATAFGGDLLGDLAVLVAAVSYAGAAIFQRRKLRGMDVYQASLGPLMLTSLIAIPIAAPSVPGVHLDWHSIAAVVFLGAAGSGIAYLLYFYVLNSLGPVRGSGVTLLVPVTAVFWGVVLLRETVSAMMVAGMLVILGGIVLTNLKRRSAADDPTRGKQTAT